MSARLDIHIWVLAGYRTGEQSQLYALAEALADDLKWYFIVKKIVYHKSSALLALARHRTLWGINKQLSDPLQSPWPDVVIAAGLKSEPVARWIRQQARLDRHRTFLVHIGRTWADVRAFDLVITTPQYRVPLYPNVLHNPTTLHRITPSRLENYKKQWIDKVSYLPRPYITVLIGGHSGPYTFRVRDATRLGTQANALAQQCGGSLLITTSARTPAKVIEPLQKTITVPSQIFIWKDNSQENPYMGYLALADALIVTGDSVSMLSEACAIGKPLYIFPFGEGAYAMHGVTQSESSPSDPAVLPSRKPFSIRWPEGRLSAWLYAWLMRYGHPRLTRDLRLFHKGLIEAGYAVWLGQPWPHPQPSVSPLPDARTQAIRRIRQLVMASYH